VQRITDDDASIKTPLHGEVGWGGEEVVMNEHRLKALLLPFYAMWCCGEPIDVKTVDDCLAIGGCLSVSKIEATPAARAHTPRTQTVSHNGDCEEERLRGVT
jgi:hypothetical protein